jgi:hydrogenase nickel incorporation protein HypA/HybF
MRMTFSILDISCKGINLKLAMHEFSLTNKLFECALKKANGKRIVRVNLLIGPFSEEREESIQFYWKDLAQGSVGEGAEVHFDHVEIELKCLDCSGAFYLDQNDQVSVCRYCYGEHMHLLGGENVRIESIEVE